MEENQNTETPNPNYTVGQNLSSPVIPSSTGNPEQSPITKRASKFSIKAIIGTLIFLLLAGGAAAGYVYREPILKLVSNPTPTPTVVISPTPTLNPTEDWKTYTGKGYSFKYPTTFQDTGSLLKSPDHKVNTDGIETLISGIELNVFPRPTKETSIEKMYDADRFGGQIESTKTSTTVAEKDAIRYDYSYENTQATVTIFINNGVYYWVKLRWADEQAKLKYLPIYYQILSTFEFTDITPTPPSTPFDCHGEEGCNCYSNEECISKICTKKTPDSDKSINSGVCAK